MQVLVADDEITSRVMVETALRERGHTVRNCDDGFEAARLLSSQYAPRIAVISNTLARLRGLDVCRFLCATGKKTGVYVILVTDVMDMELVEFGRRAGVDDIITRPVAAASFHSHLDAAGRVVELEDELKRVHGALQGLAAFESPLDKKAKALREANAALLDSAKKKTDAETPPLQTLMDKKTAPAATQERPAARDGAQTGKVYRGVRIFPDKEAKPEPAAPLPSGSKSLMGEPLQPARPPQGDIDAILAGAGASGAPAQPSARPAASNGNGHDEAQQAVLAGAEQLQNEELADDEIIHPFEFDDIILNVFSGMGVTLKTELPPKALPEGPIFASWVGISILAEPLWMDVMVVVGEAAAKAVTKELLGQSKVSDNDVCEMFAELQNMIQGSLRRYLEEKGHKAVLQLAIPRASKRDEPLALPSTLLPSVDSGFSFNGGPLNAMLFEHREFATYDNVMDLHCYDLICDPVKKAGAVSELLVTGAIVRVREKGIVEGVTGRVGSFRVMHASPLAQAIGPARLLEAPGAVECCDAKP